MLLVALQLALLQHGYFNDVPQNFYCILQAPKIAFMTCTVSMQRAVCGTRRVASRMSVDCLVRITNGWERSVGHGGWNECLREIKANFIGKSK